MNFISRIAVAFYVSVICFIGVCMIFYAMHLFISYENVRELVSVYYYVPEGRQVLVAAAGLLLFLNYFFMRAISSNVQREKTIAFDNPGGRVSVALSALDNLVRRVMMKVPEVKDVRSSIRAGKKSLTVESSITLNKDVNIPEMTSKLQDVVKRKIQDTIGVEESVVVRVHVSKIVPGHEKPKISSEEQPEEVDQPTVPFHGYRA